jgi:hypothetical protein
VAASAKASDWRKSRAMRMVYMMTNERCDAEELASSD